MSINPILYIDGYKLGHRDQYPDNTTLVYGNFTPRTSRNPNISSMVFFGLQYAIKEYLINRFNNEFFMKPKDEVVGEYKSLVKSYIGGNPDVSHIAKLHDLGYLPIKIKAVPEGTSVPMGCPAMTIVNTHSDFFWLPNYFETMISSLVWGPSTSATTAKEFRKVFDKYANETSDNPTFVDWQGHDFSYRGMFGTEAAIMSGAAHLLFFRGTDTIPAIKFLEDYYGANRDKELIGGSVPASEHSCLSAGGQVDEMDTIKRLINKIYPTGKFSLISDTYDLFQLVSVYLPQLKRDIIRRWELDPTSKLVIRPDSGIPHKIISGNPDGTTPEERKGVAELLYETFDGKVNSKGYIELHPCIGMIYGDGINFQEQINMLQSLKDKGFASTNIVLGMGSFTFQYVTRDTYGTVCKATYCEVDGVGRNIFKDPKTGGWKKSHKGLLRVNADFTYKEECSWQEESEGILTDVFKDGKITSDTLANIRQRVGVL